MFFLLAIIIIALLYIYYKRKYFTLHGPIPGKSPQFYFGNILQAGLLSGKYLGDITSQLQTEYGDTYQFFMGSMHFIYVCNPDDVQHIFTHRHIYGKGDTHVRQHRLVFHDAIICTEGHEYKRHATVVLPLFRRSRILNNLDLIIDCTEKLFDQWRLKIDNDPNHIFLNTVDQCQRLILTIFGLIGFDYDLQILDETNINNKRELSNALYDFIDIFTKTFYMPEFVSKIYLKVSPRYRHAMAIINKYLNRMIEQEQSKTSEEIAERKRTSLIASLVTSLQQNEISEATKPEDEKKGLSRTEVYHEMLLFLVAGSETTGTVVSWFIYFMSKYPRVQTKIKAELGDNRENRLTIEQLDSLVYLDCVIEEYFSFIQRVTCTVRSLIADDRLPGSGVQLHKGDEIFIPFHNLSRDKRCWKIDPELFYPERFQGEDKDHHPYAVIPFGGGHRQCIGQDLARFEVKVIAARMMQCVTFSDAGPDVNKGGYIQRLTTMPKHVGVTISFD